MRADPDPDVEPRARRRRGARIPLHGERARGGRGGGGDGRADGVAHGAPTRDLRGHTLSMMAFPGATAAALIAVPATWGYFAFCGTAALVIGRSAGGGRRSFSEQSASIGAVQAFALAVGFLFVSLYGGVLGDLESPAVRQHPGRSPTAQVLLLAVRRGGAPGRARAARAPAAVRVGGPGRGARAGRAGAGAVGARSSCCSASRSRRPARSRACCSCSRCWSGRRRPRRRSRRDRSPSLALTVAIGLATVWVGLGLSYFSVYPAGFFITTISFAVYVLARAAVWARDASRRRAALAPADLARPAPSGA